MPPCKASPLILSITRLHANVFKATWLIHVLFMPQASLAARTCIVVLVGIVLVWFDAPDNGLSRSHRWSGVELVQPSVQQQHGVSCKASRCNACGKLFRVETLRFQSKLGNAEQHLGVVEVSYCHTDSSAPTPRQNRDGLQRQHRQWGFTGAVSSLKGGCGN